MKQGFERTETFAAILAPVDADIADLQGRRDQLARTIENKQNANVGLSKSKQKPTLADENRLASLAKKLLELQDERGRLLAGDIGCFNHYQLLKIQAEMSGWVWTPEAAATLNDPRAQHEGRGEKALHMVLGREFTPGHAARDLEGDDGGDVKWMESLKKEAPGVQPIQVGTSGREGYIDFIMRECDAGMLKRKDVDLETFVAFRRGEVTRKLIDSGSIPIDVIGRLLARLLPSNILSSYGNVYGAFSFGYVVVPADDADEAWSLISVTKCLPRYALNKAYTHRKVMAGSVAQHRSNVAA